MSAPLGLCIGVMVKEMDRTTNENDVHTQSCFKKCHLERTVFYTVHIHNYIVRCRCVSWYVHNNYLSSTFKYTSLIICMNMVKDLMNSNASVAEWSPYSFTCTTYGLSATSLADCWIITSVTYAVVTIQHPVHFSFAIISQLYACSPKTTLLKMWSSQEVIYNGSIIHTCVNCFLGHYAQRHQRNALWRGGN